MSTPKITVLVIATLIALWLASAKWLYNPKSESNEHDVQPLIIPDFKAIKPAKARKAAFFQFLLPLINTQNSLVLNDRQQLIAISKKPVAELSEKELQFFKDLSGRYGLVSDRDTWPNQNDIDQLLSRVDIIAPSLALAQAASESGWGRSRFAREGHNYFGEWCFTEGCGFTPTQRVEGAIHEVRRFTHPQESVAAYFYNLNTGDAYAHLRTIRAQLRAADQPITGLQLALGLLNYSERREAYIEDIQKMIRGNKLSQFDQEPLSP